MIRKIIADNGKNKKREKKSENKAEIETHLNKGT